MHRQVFDADNVNIGTFDGEYIYSRSGAMLYRIDEDEVYTVDLPCKYIAAYEDHQASLLNGTLLFYIEE